MKNKKKIKNLYNKGIKYLKDLDQILNRRCFFQIKKHNIKKNNKICKKINKINTKKMINNNHK